MKKIFSVLVVEDEEIVAMHIEKQLKAMGCSEVWRASCHSAAIKAVQENRPDIILMDVTIDGEIDGISTAEQIIARWRLPVVFLTAHSDAPLVERIKKTNPFGYVIKPFREPELKMAIEIALDRHDMESRLRESQERYATTLRSICDAVISVDCENRITFMNPSASELTGWDIRQSIGKLLAEVVVLDDVTTAIPPTVHAPAKEDASEQRKESFLTTKSGRRVLVTVAVSQIVDKIGVLAGEVLVLRDISEERSRQQVAIKEDRLYSLGVLAAGVAHDFNNIMTIVLGNIEMAALPTSSHEDSIGFMLHSQKACLHAKDILQQLLTFATGGDPVRQKVCLADLVREEVDFVIRSSNSKADYMIEPSLWATEVDVPQFRRVIHNLVLNAVQAMPEGGKIGVALSNQTVDENSVPSLPGGQYVSVSISDCGQGISAKHIQHIFDPFFSTKELGRGLGLSSSYSIIKKHGGLLSVKSEEGKGAEFTLFLPAQHWCQDRESSVTVEPRPEPAQTMAKKKILFMDDEPEIALLIKTMLSSAGLDVVTVSNGNQAVAAHQEALRTQNPFDLAILDLTIPGGMGGLTTFDAMKKNEPHFKAIICSGYCSESSMAEYKRFGFVDVIGKPFSMKELLQKIQSHV